MHPHRYVNAVPAAARQLMISPLSSAHGVVLMGGMCCGQSGETPVLSAAQFGHLHCLTLCVELGADVNAVKQVSTPLRACEHFFLVVSAHSWGGVVVCRTALELCTSPR